MNAAKKLKIQKPLAANDEEWLPEHDALDLNDDRLYSKQDALEAAIGEDETDELDSMHLIDASFDDDMEPLFEDDFIANNPEFQGIKRGS